MTDQYVPDGFDAPPPPPMGGAFAPPQEPTPYAQAPAPATGSYLEVIQTPHLVNGHQVMFREVTVATFMKMRAMFTTVVQSFMDLQRNARSDGSLRQEDVDEGSLFNEEGKPLQLGTRRRLVESSAVPETHAREIYQAKKQAILRLSEQLLGDQGGGQVLEFLSECIAYPPTTPAQLKDASVGTLSQILVGAFKANERVFGPLAPALRQAMAEGVKSLEKQLSNPGGSLGGASRTASDEGTPTDS